MLILSKIQSKDLILVLRLQKPLVLTEWLEDSRQTWIFSNQNNLNLSEIEWIQRHKTGSLISSCCLVACILLDANEEDKKSLMSYADNIGLAFQIADDLLDINANEKLIGKPVMQDDKNKTQIS